MIREKMSEYIHENFKPKVCETCGRGAERRELQRIECFLYDDLMFVADCCPLWSD